MTLRGMTSLLAAALASTAALAQTPESAAPAAPPEASASLSGVVVTPKAEPVPTAPCAAKDAACLDKVVDTLAKQYPAEFKKLGIWCMKTWMGQAAVHIQNSGDPNSGDPNAAEGQKASCDAVWRAEHKRK